MQKKCKKIWSIQKKAVLLHPLSSEKQGAIAQLVEQRTENPCVTGSIPVGTTKKTTPFGVVFLVYYSKTTSAVETPL